MLIAAAFARFGLVQENAMKIPLLPGGNSAFNGPPLRKLADRRWARYGYLLAPIEGATHQERGGMIIDGVQSANGHIKRLVYLPGFR